MAAARKVRITSTLGKSMVVETEALNLGEFKREIYENYPDIDKLNIVMVGADKNRREIQDNESTILPTEDFMLFFMPKDTKSGNMFLDLDDFEYNPLSEIDRKIEENRQEYKDLLAQRELLSDIKSGVSQQEKSEEQEAADIMAELIRTRRY